MKLLTKRVISGMICLAILSIQFISIGKIQSITPVTGNDYSHIITILSGIPDPDID